MAKASIDVENTYSLVSSDGLKRVIWNSMVQTAEQHNVRIVQL